MRQSLAWRNLLRTLLVVALWQGLAAPNHAQTESVVAAPLGPLLNDDAYDEPWVRVDDLVLNDESLSFDTSATVAADDVWRERQLCFSDLFAEQGAGILGDYQNYYSREGLVWLSAGFGVGALFANSSFDENLLHDTYAENVIYAPNEEFYEQLHNPKFLGNGWYTIPVFAVAALSEPLLPDTQFDAAFSEWGQRSVRTLLVGGPPVLAGQWLTGGSRPREMSQHASHWRPLEDNNGVSGHSFMGAIPFLSAAHLVENRWARTGLYAASTLPAISRINDDRHFPSQAFLGWWLAFVASKAVHATHETRDRVSISPYVGVESAGMQFELRR